MASPTKEIQKAAHSITGSSNSTGADKSKTSGRLFFLDAGGGRVFSANADGSELKTIISEGRKFPGGSMAVVGKGFAVLQSAKVRISGFVAWLVWVLCTFNSSPHRASV